MCIDDCLSLQFMLICWLSSISSISVGMYPMVLMQFPRSLQLMKPSLSLSNSLKASRSSVIKIVTEIVLVIELYWSLDGIYIKDGCKCTSIEQVEGQNCLNYPFLQMTRMGWLIWLHLIYDPSKHVPFFKNPSFGSHLLHQDVHLVNCCLIRNYIANKSKYDVACSCFCSKTPVAPHIWFKKANNNNSQNIELRAWIQLPLPSSESG